MKISELKTPSIIFLDNPGLPADRDLPKLTSEQILALQSSSTRAILTDTKEEFNRKNLELVGSSDANSNLKREDYDSLDDYLDAKINKRYLDPEVEAQYLADRRKRKTEAFYRKDLTTVIRDDNPNGQYSPATGKDRKKIAANAMEYHNDKLQKPAPVTEKWVKLSMPQAILHWIKGGRVRHD